MDCIDLHMAGVYRIRSRDKRSGNTDITVYSMIELSDYFENGTATELDYLINHIFIQ